MKEIRYSVRQTGYDSDDTKFLVTCKSHGTAPDINVYQSGEYSGELTLSQRGARELISVLEHLLADS